MAKLLRRYCCNRRLGFSGIVISISPAINAGLR